VNSKNNISILIAYLIIVTSFCAQFFNSEALHEIPQQKVLQRILNGEKQKFQLASYKNAQGEALSTAERDQLNRGELTRHYFQNRHGQVRQVRCYSKVETVHLFEKRLSRLLNSNPFENLELITIDCLDDNLNKLAKKKRSDKEIESKTEENEVAIDEKKDELTLVVSVIEQCGFPFSEHTIELAWEVMSHSGHSGLLDFYYHNFREAYKSNLFSDSLMHLLQDKISKANVFVYHDTIPKEFFELLKKDSTSLNALLETMPFDGLIKDKEFAEFLKSEKIEIAKSD